MFVYEAMTIFHFNWSLAKNSMATPFLTGRGRDFRGGRNEKSGSRSDLAAASHPSWFVKHGPNLKLGGGGEWHHQPREHTVVGGGGTCRERGRSKRWHRKFCLSRNTPTGAFVRVAERKDELCTDMLQFRSKMHLMIFGVGCIYPTKWKNIHRASVMDIQKQSFWF